MNTSATSWLCAATVLLSACASHVPHAGREAPPSTQPLLQANDRIDVNVRSATTNVALLDSDEARLADKISRRFGQTQAVAGLSENRYRVDVSITDYDNGNAFIRAMIAGPGQIRTDAVVKVYRLPANTEVSALKVSTTYAVAGIYGATSRIRDIEDPFAQSVVDALQGKGDVSGPAGKSR